MTARRWLPKAALPIACAWAWAWACACVCTWPAFADDTVLHATTLEPRAYGYRLGDLAQRRITVHAPAGQSLDPASLPRAGQPGHAIELRQLTWQRDGEGQGSRYEVRLDYQVFLSPAEVRTLEMPPLVLRFSGQPRPQDLRIDAWPITVSPLVPVEVSPRRGLGEMQPDQPPPRVDTAAATQRLQAYAVVAGLLALYLATVYIGVPWWGRRHRPFEQAWRRLHAGPASGDAVEACRQIHGALNQVAGEVLFEHGLDRFIARRPAYAALRDPLVRFFQQSRRAFFADDGAGLERAALLDLCRRCRDIERGAA